MKQWTPIIDYTKCVRCGRCFKYCKLGVIAIITKTNLPTKTPRIFRPDKCPDGCKGCEFICPANAIRHEYLEGDI